MGTVWVKGEPHKCELKSKTFHHRGHRGSQKQTTYFYHVIFHLFYYLFSVLSVSSVVKSLGFDCDICGSTGGYHG